ncbi:MAG: NUDIX domain-containing protein [bacterium]|nr:NUDIX domain-containing protein [bacterium]
MEEAQRPKVGVGVVIIKDGKILLGKRKGAHGAGQYAGPGGHLEHMESIEECAKREVLEETGLQIENVRFFCLSNLKVYAPKHYVDIGVITDWKSGDPQVLEPDRVESWVWYDPEEIPAPLFGVVPNYLESLKTGRIFWDA